MATKTGDILLNGKVYRLTSGGYDIQESIRSRPAPPQQPRSLSTFEHQDNYTYFGQSIFFGMGFPVWQGEGPFDTGYGLSINQDGTISAADAMVLGQADTANPDGWVGFRIGYTNGTEDRIIFVGKTDGKSHIRLKNSGWQSVNNGITPSKAVSHGFFSRVTLIGASDGKLYRTDLGTDWADKGKGATAPATNAFILGSFKGQLYVGYADGSIWRMNSDLTWESAPFMPPGAIDGPGFDMTPMLGASGTNVFYIITEGPSPRIYFTDGVNMFQANTITSDFYPRAAVFFGKLFLFGDQGFDVATKGACWTLGANGLSEDLSFGDGSVFEGIQTAKVEGEVILWSATGNADLNVSGIGVWNPRLERSPDVDLGFYVENTTAYSAGKQIHGLAALAGKRYMGVTGVGIYESSTPGTFKVRTGMFGADQKNMQKRWPVGEAHHSVLTSGQSVQMLTRKEHNGTDDSWGTNSSAGTSITFLKSPADAAYSDSGYRTPFLQATVVGNANGSPLTLYDMAFGYILATDHAHIKREWSIRIAIEGFDDPKLAVPGKGRQYDREGVADVRTSMQMKADLDALWNTEVSFEDIDGQQYTVLVKGAASHPSAGWPSRFFPELDRAVNDAGDVVDISTPYRLTLVQTS